MTNTFNDANQLTGNGTDSFEYDANGNLWKTNSVVSHTWDRANRLLSHGTHSYAYDGNGARIQKTVSSVVTDYLLDVQRGLTQVLRESDGTNTNHYIHSPRGIHAMNDGTNWSYMLQDGLGSVRAEIAQNVAVNGSQSYAPYGEVFGASGAMSSPFAFTGEPLDGNGLQYHRARYYDPAMGVWASLDPWEGTQQRPMSLNGYGYVEGNVVNAVDPTGNLPTLEDIRNGRSRYSCKCGWIDTSHLNGGSGMGERILGAMTANIDTSSYRDSSGGGRFIRLNRAATGVNIDKLYFIPQRLLTGSRINRIATGIYMDFEEDFESGQSAWINVADKLGTLQVATAWLGKVWPNFPNRDEASIDLFRWNPLRASRFAEEDLPSDLIGFYLAMTGKERESFLTETCDIMNQEQSEFMFEQWNQNGGFELEWTNWYKRDRPDGTTLPRPCSDETWPNELSQLVNQAERDGQIIRSVNQTNTFNQIYNPLAALDTWGLVTEGVYYSDTMNKDKCASTNFGCFTRRILDILSPTEFADVYLLPSRYHELVESNSC